jgi:hypothetical protein
MLKVDKQEKLFPLETLRNTEKSKMAFPKGITPFLQQVEINYFLVMTGLTLGTRHHNFLIITKINLQ